MPQVTSGPKVRAPNDRRANGRSFRIQASRFPHNRLLPEPGEELRDGPMGYGRLTAVDGDWRIPYGTTAGCCSGPPERRRSGFG